MFRSKGRKQHASFLSYLYLFIVYIFIYLFPYSVRSLIRRKLQLSFLSLDALLNGNGNKILDSASIRSDSFGLNVKPVTLGSSGLSDKWENVS